MRHGNGGENTYDWMSCGYQLHDVLRSTACKIMLICCAHYLLCGIPLHELDLKAESLVRWDALWGRHGALGVAVAIAGFDLERGDLLQFHT